MGNEGFTTLLLHQFLRGFWARGRVRGHRSVFVTSHRPVHLSRALLFPAWFELLHFRTAAIFLLWDERAQFFDSVVIFPKSRLKYSLCASACARVKLIVASYPTGDLRREQHVILRASFLVNQRDGGSLASDWFVGHIEQALPRW